MKQKNESNQDASCCTNERVPELVCCCHVIVERHARACLRENGHIIDITQLAADQTPNSVCQWIQKVEPASKRSTTVVVAPTG